MKVLLMPSAFKILVGITLIAITALGCKPSYNGGVSTVEAAELLSPQAPVFKFIMNDIDGHPVNLERFQGKVVMIVNTASFCGNTPQYGGLQTLYEQYRDQGFEILAFPANNFGQQEPGTSEEIKSFCYTKYALEFPLFEKISVKGDNTHPLYRYLTERSPFPGEIEWNFQKFLVNRTGEVIARYRPGLKPLSPQIVQDIEKALGNPIGS